MNDGVLEDEFNVKNSAGKYICDKCEHLVAPKSIDKPFRFVRNYHPAQAMYGDPDCDILIIGLNPANDIGWQHGDSWDKQRLENYYLEQDKKHQDFKYIKRLASVTKLLTEGLNSEPGKKTKGVEYATSTTDIVKCSSKEWPKNGSALVANCSVYLKKQIETSKPRLIFCNGKDVSSYILKTFPPSENIENITSYWVKVGDHEICIVLSYFIHHTVDKYTKRRLGKEIEERLVESKVRNK